MNFKRLQAVVIILMLILSSALVSANATSGGDSTDESVATEAPTQAVTTPPVNSATLGYTNYVKQLEKTYYKGNLGATYTKQSTTFKVWSPAADDVKVCIYRTGTDDEQYAEMLSKTTMKFSKQYGTWYLTLKGDYKNKYYTYLVTVNGETHEVVDPYAKAVGANGDRGMVVDLPSTDPKNWSKDSFNRVADPTDAVIWEISVRDFSASESSGVSKKNRGKYLAFCESGTTVDSKEGSLSTCVDYLKSLGVNYVQINPFYDFASIDETDTSTPQYNWGYDPKNYNVPEGSYSSDPYNGNTRITECKQMIQALHNAGIGVIMDVVYNHTYLSEDSWFNLIVPDYYYRISESGEWSNGSGCGNDTASERIMFREFMKNSCMYWAQEYHIDGFRFDLMGLHDVDAMNYIRQNLDTLKDGKKILMYGEAWSMSTDCASDVKLANQSNMSLLSDRIGAFNDTTRDGIKGNVFTPTDKGYIQSGDKRPAVRVGICGQSTADGWATVPSQCVNYASCHDNLTLYDKLVITEYGEDSDYRIRREDLVAMNKLSAAVVLTSQGIPFMLAGEEMGRSKDGDENSYKSDISVNEIDWNNLYKYAALTEYYKGLIQIRKNVSLFRDSTDTNALAVSFIEGTDKGVIAYTLSDKSGAETVKNAAVIFNATDSSTVVDIPAGLCDSWTVVADDTRAGIIDLGTITDNKVTVAAHSCAILVDSKSFAEFSDIDTDAVVDVLYRDKSTDSVVYEQIIKGTTGDKYSVNHPSSVLFKYDIKSTKGELNGIFKDGITTITVDCEKYDGDFSTVIIHYINEYGDEIADSTAMNNRVGQQYYTAKIAGVYGYRLDLSKLPENGAGKYTDENIDINYYYNSIEVSAEEAAIDPDKLTQNTNCYANVIYMADDGEILETKSYMGDEGDQVEISYLEFDGYKYISDTGDDAVFSPTETNIVVNYASDNSFMNIILVISAALAGIALLAAILILSRRGSKKFSDDDFLIEE